VAIDTRAISRLIDYPFADMTITAEAGMTLAALRQVLAGQNQRVLLDAPYADRATLGGIFATGTTGPRRFGAGRPRDQLIGVSFVSSDGAVVKGGGRVVKNVAGYDFPKLLTGSMGTLGIITQLTLKVRPIPEASAIRWAPVTEPPALAAALDRLNLSGARPIAVELLNRPAALAVGRKLALTAAHAVLAIGVEDNAESVGWQIDRLRTEVGGADVAVVAGEQASSLWESLAEFQAAAPGPLSMVANLRPSSVVSFTAALDPDRWSAQVHAGSGIVRGHALGDWTLETALRQVDALRRTAVADGGNLILTRCPVEWKEPLRVWGEPRPDRAIAERVRAALDPKGAMNPGRFVVG
jgi:glycolate oxidase FAD binding subunit